MRDINLKSGHKNQPEGDDYKEEYAIISYANSIENKSNETQKNTFGQAKEMDLLCRGTSKRGGANVSTRSQRNRNSSTTVRACKHPYYRKKRSNYRCDDPPHAYIRVEDDATGTTNITNSEIASLGYECGGGCSGISYYGDNKVDSDNNDDDSNNDDSNNDGDRVDNETGATCRS
jgi:hypothetical protein